MREEGPKARRVPVATEEPLLGGDRYDYADAFEIAAPSADERSPEQLARSALEHAPAPLRWTIRTVHTRVLRFRLGPLRSPDHVLGWKIVASGPDAIHLETGSRLARAVIVGRRVEAVSRVTTYVFYLHPAGRLLFKLIAPLHRRIAPYLMERAALEARRTQSADVAAAR